MLKKLWAPLAAVAFGLTAAPLSAEPLKELNVSYVTSPFNLQVMVTKQNELLEKEFEKDGIKINWHEITSGPKQAQAMAAGSLDFGMVMNTTSLLISNAAGNPIKVVAGVARPYDTFALVSADDEIRSFADLKGKTVAGPKGTVLHQLLVAGLEKEGLSEADINMVAMPLPKARVAMLAGQIDAALLAASLVIKSEEEGAHVVATAKGLVRPLLVLTSHEKFVEENPEIVERVVKVHQEAMDWINENPTEAIALGAEASGISVADAEKLAGWANFTTKMNADDLASMEDDMAFLIKNEMMREKVEIPSLFTAGALEN
ncbi:aliphatic sulfonate ABC transporter substrate-binding protein [Rhodobacteraceae bacterium RKSG542]|uniref:ABC transporter substrate-binding protein n=1 Tax=Pseudovibrio flavus TaxID=2529854 RepID=UPI0012BD1686|nr:NrtA/SsuA/CpmA family ABC transporter substrate-binding protein [Pseudovibrio flavus]MTI17104.1 aliphatic sulfonate ABC transporter substrate-binding protein [Pseudovibrio flavus]